MLTVNTILQHFILALTKKLESVKSLFDMTFCTSLIKADESELRLNNMCPA